MRRIAIGLLAIAAISRGPAPVGADGPSEIRRVLFIGNSLTASNDLPAIVAALAKAAGQASLVWKGVLVPDSSLEDHWNAGAARRAIAAGGWEVVVLQQGPSSLPESRRKLLEYAGRFAGEIRKAGARPAMYMVWPSAGRVSDFDRVCESYRLAAREIDGLLFPVGEAWRAAWRRDARVPLYSPDGLHPTAEGSYLAGLVIFEGLYGRTPVGLPSRLERDDRAAPAIDLPPARAALLQEAAAEANERFGRH